MDTSEKKQVKIKLTHHELTPLLADLEVKLKEGYTFAGGGCAYKIGMTYYVDLVLASAIEEQLAKEKAEKEQDLSDQLEASTLAKEEEDRLIEEGKLKEEENLEGQEKIELPKATLDEETKAIVDIDWELLKEKVGEDDRAFLKEYAKRWGVNLPKTMSAKNQLAKFKVAIEKL